MSWNHWIRQTHRWVSIAFILAVAIVAALTWLQGEPAVWVYLAPGLGLAVLAVTGLYLFVQPYVARRRRR